MTVLLHMKRELKVGYIPLKYYRHILHNSAHSEGQLPGMPRKSIM
jgi:hypothetical protein